MKRIVLSRLTFPKIDITIGNTSWYRSHSSPTASGRSPWSYKNRLSQTGNGNRIELNDQRMYELKMPTEATLSNAVVL